MVKQEQEKSLKNQESFISQVMPLVESNSMLAALIKHEQFDHEVKIILDRTKGSGRKTIEKFIDGIQTPADRAKILADNKAVHEAMALITLHFSDNPDDQKKLADYIARATTAEEKKVQPPVVEKKTEPNEEIPVVIPEETKTTDELEPTPEKPEVIKEPVESEEAPSGDTETADESGDLKAAAEETKDEERIPVRHWPADRQTVQFTQENLEKMGIDQRSRIAMALVDERLSDEDIQQIVLSPFEKSLTGDFRYKDKDLDFFLQAEDIQALIAVISKAKKQKVQGIGINRLLNDARQERLKPLFSDPVVLATMLQEYELITEDMASTGEESTVTQDEPETEPPTPVASPEPEQGIADIATELAGEFSDEDEEPADEELQEAIQVTEEDMAETERTGAQMSTEPEEIVVTEGDVAAVEKPQPDIVITAEDLGDTEAAPRQEVTFDQFIQLAKNEKYNPALFFSKFLNDEGTKVVYTELLQQYSDSEISSEELQAGVVKYAVERSGINVRIGTHEASNPELLAEFFSELLGDEIEVETASGSDPLLANTGGRNLLRNLGKVARGLVPDGLKFWGGSEKSVDEMSAKELAKRLNITEEAAQKLLDKRKKKKEAAEELTGGTEVVLAPQPEITEPETDEVAPVVVEEPETTDESAAESDEAAGGEEDGEDQPQTEILAEKPKEDGEKKVEIPAEIKSRVQELLKNKDYEALEKFFFDEMKKAAGTDQFEPLSKAFQLVANFLK